MSNPQVTVQNFDLSKKKSGGLQAGSHVLIKCSACRAHLVDVWVNLPNSPEKWKAKANCPYCGDMSYPVEWEGGFAPAGIYEILEEVKDGPDEDRPLTRIVDFPDKGDGILYFQVEKVGNGKPVITD